MSHPLVRLLAVLGTAALCAGPTECNDFSEVVVPASDASRPIIVHGHDSHPPLAARWAVDAPFSEQLVDPNQTVIAVVSGYDPGGVSRLTVGWSVSRYCGNGDVGVLISPLVASQTETQTGAPGSTVSNGIWLARGFRPASYGCPSGYTLESVSLSWSVEAENFHGLESSRSGSMHWSAP